MSCMADDLEKSGAILMGFTYAQICDVNQSTKIVHSAGGWFKHNGPLTVNTVKSRIKLLSTLSAICIKKPKEN